LHYAKTFLSKLHIKTGFLQSMGYQKSEKATLGNYIDKVEVVREVKAGVGVFWLAFRWSF
jgi:hypothetical protein